MPQKVPLSVLAGAGTGLLLTLGPGGKRTVTGGVFRTAGFAALFFGIAKGRLLPGVAGAAAILTSGAFDIQGRIGPAE